MVGCAGRVLTATGAAEAVIAAAMASKMSSSATSQHRNSVRVRANSSFDGWTEPVQQREPFVKAAARVLAVSQPATSCERPKADLRVHLPDYVAGFFAIP